MCINQDAYTNYNTTTTTSKCETATGHADLPWRDNWLVRHHGNNAITIGNIYTSQSDAEPSPIHGKFFNQSNQELHLIHTNEFVFPDVANRQDELLEYEDDENPYDNPWPGYLVKLPEGDILVARKGVERASSINTHTTESSEGRRRLRTESLGSADVCMCRNVRDRSNMSPTCQRFHYRKRDTGRGALAVVPKRYHVHRHGSTVSLQHEPNVDYPRRKRTLSEPSQAVTRKTTSSQTPTAENTDAIKAEMAQVQNKAAGSETLQTVTETKSYDSTNSQMSESKEAIKSNKEFPAATPSTNAETTSHESSIPKPTTDDTDQHQRAKFAFVSKLQGAVGTMQFKK